jgi:hypothetical protein
MQSRIGSDLHTLERVRCIGDDARFGIVLGDSKSPLVLH